MPTLNTYLFFDGNCAEAMRFYERALGGKLDLITVAQSPEASRMPAEQRDKVLHARLAWDGGALFASDWIAPDPFPGKAGYSVWLIYPTATEAKKAFDALVDGGQVRAPLAKTFWVEAFGMLADRFGTAWMVSGGTLTS